MSPWIRYDDAFHDDVRVMELSNLAAMGLFVVCFGYSCQKLLDGWVPVSVVRQKGSTTSDLDELIRELERVQLWTPADRKGITGFQIAADLVALQPTREQVEEARAAARIRKDRWKGRKRNKKGTGQSRRDKSVPEAFPEQEGNGDVTPGERLRKTYPDPDPVPVPDPRKDKSTGAFAPASSRQEPPRSEPTHGTLCKLAEEIVDAEPNGMYSDHVEALKVRCAELRMGYGCDSAIQKAINAVLEVRRLRTVPSSRTGASTGFVRVGEGRLRRV